MFKGIFLIFAVIFGSEILDEKNLALYEKAYVADTNLKYRNATNHGCDDLGKMTSGEMYYVDLRKVRHIKELQFSIESNPEISFNVTVQDDNSDFNNWVAMETDLNTSEKYNFSWDINRRYVGFKIFENIDSLKICNVSIAGVPEELTNIESSCFEWTIDEEMFNLIKDSNSSTCIASHNAKAHHLHLYIPVRNTLPLSEISASCTTGKKYCKLEYATSPDFEKPETYCNITNKDCSQAFLRNIYFVSRQENKHEIELCEFSMKKIDDKGVIEINDFKWVQNHNTSLLSDNNTQSCLVTPWLFVNGALIVLPLLRRLNFIRIYATCKIEQNDCEYKVDIGNKSFDCKRGWCEHTFTSDLVKFISISFEEKAEFEVCEVSFEKMAVTRKPKTTKQKGNGALIPRKKPVLNKSMIKYLIAVVGAATLVLTLIFIRKIIKYKSNIVTYQNKKLTRKKTQIKIQNNLQNAKMNVKRSEFHVENKASKFHGETAVKEEGKVRKNDLKNDLENNLQNDFQEDAKINVKKTEAHVDIKASKFHGETEVKEEGKERKNKIKIDAKNI